jgi:anti-anti-sigma regulatory factor
MVHAEVNAPKNLLTISYVQHVDAKEMKQAEEQLQLFLHELKPGFRLLADLTNLELMDLACVPHLRRMMDLCNRKGVEKVVRVIPDPNKDIGMNILSLFHYHRRVKIVTCETLTEAIKLLEA